MKNILHFLKMTIVGGILFLVPVIILTIVVSKALQITRMVVKPLSDMIPVETVAGIALTKLLAIAMIVFFCFLAGLLAKTSAARKMISWIENALLSNLPGYSVMKGVGESVAGGESDKPHELVLARIEDAWQIAFLVERIDGGHAALFVPDATNPSSGSVYFMTEDRIKPLDVPVMSAIKCLRRLGIGANALLKGRL